MEKKSRWRFCWGVFVHILLKLMEKYRLFYHKEVQPLQQLLTFYVISWIADSMGYQSVLVCSIHDMPTILPFHLYIMFIMIRNSMLSYNESLLKIKSWK